VVGAVVSKVKDNESLVLAVSLLFSAAMSSLQAKYMVFVPSEPKSANAQECEVVPSPVQLVSSDISSYVSSPSVEAKQSPFSLVSKVIAGVVSVVIEILAQIEAQLTMHEYET